MPITTNLDPEIVKLERQVYHMTFSELRTFLQSILNFQWWPGDAQVMMELLQRYTASFSRNDRNCRITVTFTHGNWTHVDALTATLKAFAYHAKVFNYLKEKNDESLK
jgi:hypothetical protein